MVLFMQLLFSLTTLQMPFLKAEHHIILSDKKPCRLLYRIKSWARGGWGQHLIFGHMKYPPILYRPCNYYNVEGIKCVQIENGKHYCPFTL